MEEESKTNWSWVPSAIIGALFALGSFAVTMALDSIDDRMESLDDKIAASQQVVTDDIKDLDTHMMTMSDKLSSHIEEHPSKQIYVELGILREQMNNIQDRMERIDR